MEELVYSPILNYVQSNQLNGIDNDTIKKYGIDFYADVNEVKDAKAKLWEDVCPQ